MNKPSCFYDDSYNNRLLNASSEGNVEDVVKLLANADVNCQNSYQQTPSHRAAALGHKNVLEVLVGNKANLNCQDYSGNTAFSYAFKRGHYDIVQYLLVYGQLTDVTPKKNEPTIPYLWALKHRFFNTARLIWAREAKEKQRVKTEEAAKSLLLLSYVKKNII